jgi:hypothetical protein
MAAQRVSSGASFRTAIFIRLLEDEKHDEADDEADYCAPFEHAREPLVIVNVDRHVLRGRAREQRFFFVGHVTPFL